MAAMLVVETDLLLQGIFLPAQQPLIFDAGVWSAQTQVFIDLGRAHNSPLAASADRLGFAWIETIYLPAYIETSVGLHILQNSLPKITGANVDTLLHCD